jgi:hypothetical protein
VHTPVIGPRAGDRAPCVINHRSPPVLPSTVLRGSCTRVVHDEPFVSFIQSFFIGFLRMLFTIHEELGDAGASAEYYDERED